MRKSPWFLAMVGASVVFGADAESAAAARSSTVRAEFPRGATGGPRGKIQVTHWKETAKRPERVRIVLQFTRLDPGTTYSLWGDDPHDPLVRFGLFAPFRVTPRRRAMTLRYDTRDGALPFDATLAELVGKSLQLRDESGTVLVAGSFRAPAAALR